MDKLLNDIYYKPGIFTNAKELHKLAQEQDPTIKYEDVKEWLDKQLIHQITKRPIKKASTGHFYVSKPNQLHQMDILFMPHDKDKHKYILTMIDTASRYKAAQPLKDKSSQSVVNAINKIYKDTKLKFPEQINVDKGSEFKAEVIKLFEDKGTKVNVSDTGHHRSTAMVERFNRLLAERLFKQIHHEEINTNKVVRNWTKLLQPTIEQLNNEITRYIKMTPNEAIELDRVPQKDHNEEIPIEEEFKVGDLVRYKIANDKIQDISSSTFDNNKEVESLIIKNGRKRATDANYSLAIHMIENVKRVAGVKNLYYLNDIKHGFTASNLIKAI